MRKKTASEIICENFKIPPETIFQDYKCTYRSSVLFFGRLYIGEEHFLFIANMFGLVKKCAIRIESIKRIEETQNYSAITIAEMVDGHEIEYMFGSFKNNNAYQLMRALWKGEKIGSDVLNKHSEDENEEFDKLQSGQSKPLIDEGHVEANFFNPQAIESEKQKIVEIQFPCSVEQFYSFFLADNATMYPRKKHLESRGATNVTCTQWRKSEELNSEVREINGTLKVSGVPFVKQAGMSQVWMLKRQEDSLQLNIVTQMADVPYSAYFNCEEHIMVTKEGDKKCRMSVQLTIVFNKSTYMKGTIIGRTQGDIKQEYGIWIKNVTALLDQIRRKKDSSDAQKPRVEVEYESNVPFSDKNLPNPATPKKTPAREPRESWLKKPLTMEQKVDLTFKLVLLIAVANGIILMKLFL